MRHQDPEYTLFLHDDREVVVRYDFEKAQRQTRDEPGFPASVWITEIDLGDGFVRFDTCGLPERTRQGLEDELLTKLNEDAASDAADQAQAEAEYLAERAGSIE